MYFFINLMLSENFLLLAFDGELSKELFYSHSIFEFGLFVMSITTRLIP